MKKTILTAAMLLAAIGAAQAQKVTNIKVQNKQDVMFDLLSGQYNDNGSIAKDTKATRPKHREPAQPKAATVTLAMQSALVNSPDVYNIAGEDKYLKKKEENKRYKEFQVYDINGLDKEKVVLGLLTNTLDRAVRYDENGGPDKKIYVSTSYIDKFDEKGQVIPGKKVQVSTLRLNDKVFVIIGENDYRYQDGKRLVGEQKLVDEMIKGKPVTEITFYYELQKAGILGKNLSLRDFTKMDLNQKQTIVEYRVYRS